MGAVKQNSAPYSNGGLRFVDCRVMNVGVGQETTVDSVESVRAPDSARRSSTIETPGGVFRGGGMVTCGAIEQQRVASRHGRRPASDRGCLGGWGARWMSAVMGKVPHPPAGIRWIFSGPTKTRQRTRVRDHQGSTIDTMTAIVVNMIQTPVGHHQKSITAIKQTTLAFTPSIRAGTETTIDTKQATI